MSSDFERLVGRAILDREFRKQLLDDPEGAVKGAGFSISEAELNQIREAAKDRGSVDRQLDGISVRGIWQ